MSSCPREEQLRLLWVHLPRQRAFGSGTSMRSRAPKHVYKRTSAHARYRCNIVHNISSTMLRQLLTCRQRHVPCTLPPLKVFYSQTPTRNAKHTQWTEKVAVVSYLTQWSIHVRTGPNPHKYPTPGSQPSNADHGLHPKVENGLLSVIGEGDRRTRFVVSVTQVNNNNETQSANSRPVQAAGSGVF